MCLMPDAVRRFASLCADALVYFIPILSHAAGAEASRKAGGSARGVDVCGADKLRAYVTQFP